MRQLHRVYIGVTSTIGVYRKGECQLKGVVLRIHRPANEPGFYLERQEGAGRQIVYTIKSYSVQANAEGARY